MFQGTVPHQALRLLATVVKEWNCKRIFVGCSGNFTIERAISKIVSCPIISNDVTIYSCYIGEYLSGKSVDDLKVKEDYQGYCSYFRDYMKDDVSKVATLILATDILGYENQDNLYAKRMLTGYKEQFSDLHQSLCKKLESIKVNIQDFYKGDVMDMLNDIEPDDGFVSFPPFFKGGYEKMWSNISKVFEFTEPKYEEFDPEVSVEKLCNKVKTLSNFFLITERPVEQLKEFATGQSETSKGKTIYFYSRTTKTHYLKPQTPAMNAKPLLKIAEEDSINGDTLEIREVTYDQFRENRALYLSTNVSKVARPQACYGLFSDGKLFGMFGLSSSYMLSASDRLEHPIIYLMTDFAVSPTSVKHLSKLVLCCVLSKEVQLIAEQITRKRVKSIATNAFSNNVVSMKYRGLFEQYGRRVIEKDEEGKPTKYNLSYGAPAGQWTLKEGYEKWKRKFCK